MILDGSSSLLIFGSAGLVGGKHLCGAPTLYTPIGLSLAAKVGETPNSFIVT